MKLFCIDFETYYSQTFSLTKQTTEEYIRSKQFETIGVAVCEEGANPIWFSGTKADTKAFLDGFELDKHIVVAHNAIFDMAILNWEYDIRPKGIADTLSMARAIHGTEVGGSLAKLAEHYNLGVKGTEVLDAKGKYRIDFTPQDLAQYGEYCKNDVALTMSLFEVLSADFPATELRLIDLTIRMFTEPKLWLDGNLLHNHLDDIMAQKNGLLSMVASSKEDLMSNDKFAQILQSLDVVPPTKIISSISETDILAFFKADLHGSIVRLTSESTNCSNLDLVRVLTKCFGTPSTGIIYGKLISVEDDDDNSILAFSADSLSLCKAIGSLVKSIPFSSLNSDTNQSMIDWSKSSPPRCVSPSVESTSNTPSPNSRIDTSCVPPPQSKTTTIMSDFFLSRP